MSTLQEYIQAQKLLETKYSSKNCIVLMQIGSFYEMYSVRENGILVGNTDIASRALGMKLVRKSMEQEVYMVGFPDYALHSYVSKLLEANLVVAVYDQYNLPNSKSKGRKLVNIYTPSNYINSDYQVNGLLSIFVDEYKCIKTGNLLKSIHYSIINLIDGNVLFSERYDNVITEIQRIIYVYNPNEIIISGKNIEIQTNKPIFKLENNSNFNNISFQNEILKKVYPNNSILSSVEYLQLERYPNVVKSLVYAFDYLGNVKSLKNPSLIKNNKHLLLNGDTINQLHIEELFNLLNFTKTIGKQFLRNRLFNPITGINELKRGYSIIENISENKELSLIGDLYKQSKLISIKKISINHFFGFIDSLKNTLIVLSDNRELFEIPNKVINNLETLSKHFECIFDNDNKIFLKGVFPELDLLNLKINEIEEFVKDISSKLDCKIESNSDFKFIFIISATKLKNIKDTIFKYNNFDYKIKSDNFVKKNKGYILDHNLITEINRDYTKLLTEYNSLVDIKFKEELSKIPLDLIIKVADYIAEIDFYTSCSIASKKYGYDRPIPVKSERSYLIGENIRHPLIEQISEDEYIPNDFEIGKGKYGALITGQNTTGKTTLLRSVGCCIIMAQAGCFVPCSKFTFSPFKKMFCKITTKDDQFSGKSTFLVEMEEVRNIILNSDINTLVISDELCCSTETDSARAIVSATLETLLEKQSNFIFSTHLHNLSINSDLLKLYHFNLKIENNKIIYNRKLQNGDCEELYGLEIAGTLGLGDDFMKKCYKLRKNNLKLSRYNNSLVMESCENCGSKQNLHTHHIIPQEEANEEGLIDNRFHKNKKFNLKVLCETCHRRHHANKI